MMNVEFEKVDINRADVDELTQITGIGEGLAGRIVEYRETVHPFEEVIELAAVPGISERMVRGFADRVTVEPIVVLEKTAVPPPTLALEPVEELELEEAVELETELAEPKLEPGTAEEFLPDFELVEPELEEELEAEEFLPEAELVELEPELALEEEIVPEVELAEPEIKLASEPEEAITPEMELAESEPEPELEEETAVSEPEPIAIEPAPTPVPPPAPAPRPKRALGAILLGSILGAFVGALLTLAILAALNGGTLTFTQADARLGAEINEARQFQDDLSQTVDSLDTELNNNLGAVATRTGEMLLQQQETSQSLQEMRDNVAELEEITDELDERLTSVAVAAETFDAFLDGLRNLLVDLQGMPVPTMTPYATPIPKTTTTVTPAAENTEGATEASPTTPASTRQLTRTPRPTATPISLPTSTPGQQP